MVRLVALMAPFLLRLTWSGFFLNRSPTSMVRMDWFSVFFSFFAMA